MYVCMYACQLITLIDDRASWDLVLTTDTRLSSSPTSADTRIKYLSRRSILFHTKDMDEPVHNVYVVLCRKSQPTQTGRRSYVGFFSRMLHQCLIGSMPLRHKKALMWSISFVYVTHLSIEPSQIVPVNIKAVDENLRNHLISARHRC